MDYTMCTDCTKGKKEIKLLIQPTTNLERQFFTELFTSGQAVIETVPNTDEITITLKEREVT